MSPQQLIDKIAHEVNDEFFNIVKQESEPNLFTVLEIIPQKNKDSASISVYHILNIAKRVIDDWLGSLQTNPPKRSGSGTELDPILLAAHEPADWLWFAKEFQLTEKKELVYFKIANQIISITTNERKVSAESAISTVEEVYATSLQTFENLLVSEDIFELVSAVELNSLDSISHLFPIIGYFIESGIAKSGDLKELPRETPYTQAAKAHAETTFFTPETLNQPAVLERMQTAKNVLLGTEDSDAMTSDDETTIDVHEVFSQVTEMCFDRIQKISGENQAQLQAQRTEFEQKALPEFQALFPKKVNSHNFFTLFSDSLNNFRQLHEQTNQTTHPVLGKDNAQLYANLIQSIKDIPKNKVVLPHIRELGEANSLIEIRAILRGKALQPNLYLPVTVAALFFSESSRYPLSFIASLVLLDLIQAKKCCPDDNNRSYTLLNMLVNPTERDTFVDGYGRKYLDGKKEKTEKQRLRDDFIKKYNKWSTNFDLSPIPLEPQNRNPGQKKLVERINKKINQMIPGTVKQNVGGYHAMVQGGSYDDIKNIKDSNRLSLVEQKTASTLLQWLAIILRRAGLTVKLRKRFLELSSNQQEKFSSQFEKLIYLLLEERAKSFDYLLFNVELINKIKQIFPTNLQAREPTNSVSISSFFTSQMACQSKPAATTYISEDILLQLAIFRSIKDTQDNRNTFNLLPTDLYNLNGDCLFTAISAFMPNSNANIIRQTAVLHLKSDTRLQETITIQAQTQNVNDHSLLTNTGNQSYSNFIEYVDLMALPQTYGTHIEIVALARAYQRPIVVLTPNNQYDQIVSEQAYATNDPMFINYIGNNHYQTLLVQNGNAQDIVRQIAESINSRASRLCRKF